MMIALFLFRTMAKASTVLLVPSIIMSLQVTIGTHILNIVLFSCLLLVAAPVLVFPMCRTPAGIGLAVG
jgi:hypothetical protein